MRVEEDRVGEGSGPVVAIAGATGFVGRALVDAWSADTRLVGLTRAEPRGDDKRITWRRCDLYSLLHVERALQGVDVAIYLVHSMMPSARLVQGSFADLDLILADNFARAAAAAGVKRILYLGGPLPEGEAPSEHLRSRLEVESALAARGVPVTGLRAGLVVGPGGSSLSLLVRLVRRLPAMVLPRWTATRTQPIALDDVVRAFRYCVQRPETTGRAYDIGGPEILTYRQMLETTARVLGHKRPKIGVPFLSPTLSKLWVSLFGSTPMSLVGPLVESLRHDLLVRDNPVQAHLRDGALRFEVALRRALDKEQWGSRSLRSRFQRRKRALRNRRTVRSVQRLPRPLRRDAAWVAHEYLRWLPRFVWPLLRVRIEDDVRARFYLAATPVMLLELSLSEKRSVPDRQLFYITGGVLVSGTSRGRLEMREVLAGRYVVAAIHDFEPALPWALYDATQAKVHLWVMRGFARHLARCGEGTASEPSPRPSEGPAPRGSNTAQG